MNKNRIEFISIFFEEALLVIGQWEKECLRLEKNLNSPNYNKLYACVHNLKGAAQAIGLLEVVDFVNNIEEVVILLKLGKINLSEEIIEFLLDCQIFISRWLQKLQSAMDYPLEFGNLLSKIELLKKFAERENKGTEIKELENKESDLNQKNIFSRQVVLDWQLSLKLEELDNHLRFLKSSSGIYIWLFDGNPRRVYSIAESNNFYESLKKILSDQVFGRSVVYKIDSSEDWLKFMQEEFCSRSIKEIKGRGKIRLPVKYLKDEDDSFSGFFNHENSIVYRNFISNSSVAFATIKGISDPVIRGEIAGALIYSLRDQYNQIAGRDLKLNESGKYDLPIGDIERIPSYDYYFEHTGKALEKLPLEFTQMKPFIIQHSV